MSRTDTLAPPSTGATLAGRTGTDRRSNPWWTLVASALGVIMVALDGTVVAIANPFIAQDLARHSQTCSGSPTPICWPSPFC